MHVEKGVTERTERKLRRFGHVNRVTNDRWTKKVVEWFRKEKRKRRRLGRS